MKVLIVDDEPPARERLAALVCEGELAVVVGEAGNGAEALRKTDEASPDVVLLDIRMPGMDGLEVARHLSGMEQPPAVIFTTAYESHALAAFEAHAVDYLLKPIRRDRLTAALERARRLTRAQIGGLEDEAPGRDPGTSARTYISATMQGRLHLVPVTDVRYFRAEHKYVTVGHVGGTLLIEESLNNLADEFGDRFVRVHRNALVAIEHVRQLDKDASGRSAVLVADMDEGIEVSRRLVARVRKALKARIV